MINIRKSTTEDLPRIFEIYAIAREYMKASGNPNQWKDNRPSPERIYEDVELGQSYVMEEEGRIFATFAFIRDKDPAYDYIEDGEWPDDEPYYVVHRVASDGTHKGVLAQCIKYCDPYTDILRMDTHKDNKTMQRALEREGFVRCGVIYVDNGTPREAYYRRKR